jgi:hypothetical protein
MEVEALNTRRVATFGSAELRLLGTERIRTANNCVPRDVAQVGGAMLFGYNASSASARRPLWTASSRCSASRAMVTLSASTGPSPRVDVSRGRDLFGQLW